MSPIQDTGENTYMVAEVFLRPLSATIYKERSSSGQ